MDYKNSRYTHVLVEINNFANEPSIAKAFKNYKDMRRYTVNQAIKKGY